MKAAAFAASEVSMRTFCPTLKKGKAALIFIKMRGRRKRLAQKDGAPLFVNSRAFYHHDRGMHDAIASPQDSLCVSVTDMNIQIKVSDTLQFRLVAHT